MADEDSKITLGVLNAISENEAITQRSVATELGVALGLVNTYLKRCVRKGYVKIQQVPRNRYAYYLTPKGLAEKSRLTAEYLSQGFKFFILARREIEDIFEDCVRRGQKRIALYGMSELAEIAVLCATDSDVELTSIIDVNGTRTEYAGIPVVRSIEDIAPSEAVLITDLNNSQTVYEIAADTLRHEHVLTLPLLNISRRRSQ